MRRLIQLILLFSMSIMLYAQDSPQGDSSQEQLTIGFSQVGTESDWRTAFSDTIITEAEQRNINLLFLDAENNQENQIAAIRYFITRQVDAIILAPVIETGWNAILAETQQANIPVVIIDRNVTADETLYLTRVSSDFKHEGRLAAAWLAQATAGKCHIVELEGTVGSSAARDRHIGFMEVINLFPDMQIIVSSPVIFVVIMGCKLWKVSSMQRIPPIFVQSGLTMMIWPLVQSRLLKMRTLTPVRIYLSSLWMQFRIFSWR